MLVARAFEAEGRHVQELYNRTGQVLLGDKLGMPPQSERTLAGRRRAFGEGAFGGPLPAVEHNRAGAHTALHTI